MAVCFVLWLGLMGPEAVGSQIPEWRLSEAGRWILSEDEFPASAGGPLALGPKGQLFLAHRDQPFAVLLDRAEGVHQFVAVPPVLERAGIEGLEVITALGFRADSLWVVDRRTRRVLVLGPDQALQRWVDLSRAAEGFGAPFSPQALLSDGSVLTSNELGAAATGAGQRTGQTFTKVGPRSGERRIITTLAVGNATLVAATDQGIVALSFQPFRDQPLWGIDHAAQELIVVERPASLDGERGVIGISRVPVHGGRPLRQEIPYRPLPVPEQEAEEALTVAAERLGAYYGSRAAAMDAAHNGLYLPRYRPPVTGLLVGGDQRLWIRREWTPDRDSVEWQVVERDGSVIGRVTVPSSLTLRLVAADRVWAIERTEEGALTLVEFHVLASNG